MPPLRADDIYDLPFNALYFSSSHRHADQRDKKNERRRQSRLRHASATTENACYKDEKIIYTLYKNTRLC